MTAIQVALLYTTVLGALLWSALPYMVLVGDKVISPYVLSILFAVFHAPFGAALILFLMEVM